MTRRSTTQRPGRRAAVVAAALVMGLALLTSCADTPASSGEPGGSSSVAAGEDLAYNDADLHFAQSLAPHHDQAIAMAMIVLDKSGVDAEVRAIAEAITASHQPQLDTMNTWSWAEERTAHAETEEEEGPGHHGGQDGLMTEDQMMQLDTAEAPAAQKLFVTGMIRHHEGALAMAEAEVDAGKHPDAVKLAQAVVDNHGPEIARLMELLAHL